MLSANPKPYAIRIHQGGRLTIPRQLRESLAIEPGDTLTLLPIGDILVLTPHRLHTPELMDRMADMLEESGVSLDDLLEDLPRIRETIYQERYQSQPKD